jgi:hypothetical protein
MRETENNLCLIKQTPTSFTEQLPFTGEESLCEIISMPSLVELKLVKKYAGVIYKSYNYKILKNLQKNGK